jgi:hypothetical protein
MLQMVSKDQNLAFEFGVRIYYLACGAFGCNLILRRIDPNINPFLRPQQLASFYLAWLNRHGYAGPAILSHIPVFSTRIQAQSSVPWPSANAVF